MQAISEARSNSEKLSALIRNPYRGPSRKAGAKQRSQWGHAKGLRKRL
jgi:hypothetical protein